jgi:glycine/D-amino acid oxidase-like deaminating enzyme
MDRDLIDDGTFDVAVIGLGLAGLTAAITAARAGATVLAIDSGRAGGRARASTVEPGVVFNAGPRALYRGGAAARELSALGLTWRGGAPGTRGAAVRVGSERHTMPGTAGRLLRTRLLGTRSKVRVGWLLGTIGRTDPGALAGRSVADWVDGLRLAPDAVALVHAVLRLATYVDDPHRLDAGAAVAQLQLALGRGVEYLDGGWQTLVDQLTDVATTSGVTVRAHCGVRSLRGGGGSHPWVVDLGDTSVRSGAVVLAVGTPAAAAALSPVPLPTGGLGPPATAACLELAVRSGNAGPFLLGVDRPLYLSRHSPPARLAPPGVEVVHVVRYGVTDAAADRDELWAHAAAAGVRPDDVVTERFLRRMVVCGAIPLAERGGLAGRPDTQVGGAPGLFLAGDWVGSEGLLADAAVSSGVRAGRLAATTRTGCTA